jgi:hypothetical protein
VITMNGLRGPGQFDVRPLLGRGAILAGCASVTYVAQSVWGRTAPLGIVVALLLLLVAAVSTQKLPAGTPAWFLPTLEVLGSALVVAAARDVGTLFLPYLMVPLVRTARRAGLLPGVCAWGLTVVVLTAVRAVPTYHFGVGWVGPLGPSGRDWTEVVYTPWLTMMAVVTLLGAWAHRVLDAEPTAPARLPEASGVSSGPRPPW